MGRSVNQPWKLHAGLLLALAVVCVAATAGAGEAVRSRVYTWTDENGVAHFTNVPVDERYKPIERRTPTRLIRPRVSAREYDRLIGITARQLRLQPALVKAVIRAESNFDAHAVSHKGAQGLMQLMPATADALGVADPFHPVDNVRGGARYLRSMIDRYGDLERALAAYNAGPTAVDRYGGVPPYKETRDYVRRVLTYYRRYHADFAR